jgi:hypothetical protein
LLALFHGWVQKGFIDLPIPINRLSSIDIVIVSHNHYDHLDDKTVRDLADKNNIHVVVPLGLKPFFIERGYNKFTELDWGQSVSVEGIKVTAEPSVNDSTRSTSDHNKTLWSSWIISSFQQRIFLLAIRCTQKLYSILSVINTAPLILLFYLQEHLNQGNCCGRRIPLQKKLSPLA